MDLIEKIKCIYEKTRNAMNAVKVLLHIIAKWHIFMRGDAHNPVYIGAKQLLG